MVRLLASELLKGHPLTFFLMALILLFGFFFYHLFPKLEVFFFLPFEADKFFHSFVHLDVICCLKHGLLSPARHRHLEETDGRCYNLNFHLTFRGTPLAKAVGFPQVRKHSFYVQPSEDYGETDAEDPHSFLVCQGRQCRPQMFLCYGPWRCWITTLDEIPALMLILRQLIIMFTVSGSFCFEQCLVLFCARISAPAKEKQNKQQYKIKQFVLNLIQFMFENKACSRHQPSNCQTEKKLKKEKSKQNLFILTSCNFFFTCINKSSFLPSSAQRPDSITRVQQFSLTGFLRTPLDLFILVPSICIHFE